MFFNIDYLKNGSPEQINAWHCLNQLNIFNHLKEYSPVLCGTYPIDLITDTSDLDIIIGGSDIQNVKRALERYQSYRNFKIYDGTRSGEAYTVAHFEYGHYIIEIFAQRIPVEMQNAYLHMIIEDHLLKGDSRMKEKVLDLKKKGYSTEAAFVSVLGLHTDDPYSRLIEYGISRNIITDI